MTALILEPLAGHPKELREFVDQHLEAPFDGTPEAKKAATQTVFETFPGLENRARDLAERAAKRASADGETTDPYPGPVDRADETRGGT